MGAVSASNTHTSHAVEQEQDLLRARAVLGAKGMRRTAARLAVLRHMFAARGPESHAEVSAALNRLGFDSATIYRNLMELTRARILARIDLGDHVWRFEERRGARARGEAHPHFVCDGCGSVACLDSDYVRISGSGRSSRVARVSSITVKGRCRRC